MNIKTSNSIILMKGISFLFFIVIVSNISAQNKMPSPMANFKELAIYGHNPSYVFRGAKSDVFERGHRIPFLVSWPGKIKQASECDSTVCLTDFMATCASIIHKTLPANAAEDSYDLMPLLTQKDTYHRANVIIHSGDGFFAIKEGHWKLEFCAGSGGWGYPTQKLAKELK
jgi:arylsulfatase A